jgi:hypothetical protein
VGGNFLVDAYQIVLLAVAAGGPPFIALCFPCSTLIAGLLGNEKNVKLVYFLCIPRNLVSLRHGKRQSLPVGPGQPCADAYQRLDSGNSSAHREHRHYCSVLEKDMSSAEESRRAPNGEEELDEFESNGGRKSAKLHSQDGKSTDATLSG